MDLLRLDKTAIIQLRRYARDLPSIEKLKMMRFTPFGPYLEKAIYKSIVQFESALLKRGHETSTLASSLTGYQIIALNSIAQLKKMGIPVDLLRELYTWLSQEKVGQHLVELVEVGIQTFLIMGPDGKPAIWGALDLADYLFLGAEDRKTADVIICLNKIVKDFFKKIGYEINSPTLELFYTYRDYIKAIEYVWGKRFESDPQKISKVLLSPEIEAEVSAQEEGEGNEK